MTNPEEPSHDPPHSEENAASVTRRYSPPGNREMLAKLRLLKQLATFKAATFDPAVPDDFREIFLSGVFPDVTEDPATTYKKAIELAENYGKAIRAEEEVANDFLIQLAEQYMTNPPRERWGIVRGIGEGGAEFFAGMRVPFTQSEIEAINWTRKARQRLVSSEQLGDTKTRDFWMDSHLFPGDIRTGPFTHSLSNRPYAIWGIMTAARAAEDALTDYTGPQSGPREVAAELLTTVRDLPDKLIRHNPIPRQQ